MNFLTTGDIARQLDVDRDVVVYAIRKNKIEPVGRAGLVRLFSASALISVEKFLDAKKQKGNHRGK